MKKLLALMLAALLVLGCAACAQQGATPTTEPTTEATEPTTEATTDRNATYIQLSIAEEDGSYVSLTAYEDEEGGTYVEFYGDVRKIANMQLSVLNEIAAAVENSQLKDLNDQHVYEDGLASASMYVGYSDESCLAADFSGTVPQEFRDGYAAVESFFRQLMQDIPVYVPRPIVNGDPDPDALAEMEAILDASGAEPLDMFVISDVPMDDSFTAMMGLSKTDGIVSGLSCDPMMSAMAFSCMIAKVETEAGVDAIAKDFADNIQWNRWICVSATDATIATKGNLVLCLATTGDLYAQITDAAVGTGWTVVKTLTN